MAERVKQEQRRICWPDFDCTCLEGGCEWCNTHPFRNVGLIRRIIKKGGGHAYNRGDGSPGNLMKSFFDGMHHKWRNAESRVK